MRIFISLILIFLTVYLVGRVGIYKPEVTKHKDNIDYTQDDFVYTDSHPLVESARKQIGIVTKYDIKIKIDQDMKKHPSRYQADFDSNINFRRVRNVKIFLDNNEEKIDNCITSDCFKKSIWKAGDIVTFDQIPGSLWHIAIVSNKTQFSKELEAHVPFLIHNYGRGVVEDDMLLNWPAKITGHYRLNLE